MLNHSSATPHTIKSTKNRRLNGSATERRETHVTKSTKNKTLNRNGTSGAGKEALAEGRSRKTRTSNAVRRRAQAIIKDRSIDAETRAIICYCLLTNDKWLAELVRLIEAGETIIETIVVLKRPKLTPRIPKGKRSTRGL